MRGGSRDIKPDRLCAFTDGVVAIIITIMVLELPVPHEPGLAALRPSLVLFAAYALSFVKVGIYWSNHHHLLCAAQRVDGRVLIANLFLLFWLSLVPFVVRWVGEAGVTRDTVVAFGVADAALRFVDGLASLDASRRERRGFAPAQGDRPRSQGADHARFLRGGHPDRVALAGQGNRHLRARRRFVADPRQALRAARLVAAVRAPSHIRAMEKYHGTTILGVKKDGRTVIAGDGQVSLGNTVIKPNAKKVRRIGEGGNVIGGFAGATADAFTLFERLERKLEQYNGQLMRSAVELAKDWRTDKYLRNLEAMMIVADKDALLILTGNGDVLEPEGGIAAIGSGGNYALAAARALTDYEKDPEKLARRAMQIAAEVCVFTNDQLTVETVE